MSTFTLNSITVTGLGIISRLVAGSTLKFTRIAVGDGAMPSDKTPLTMTDLANKLFDVDIQAVESDGTGSATVTGVFSNEDKETGFFYRELGLFAEDPDTKQEVLYCYGNAAADAEWISPSGASSVIEKEVKIVTLVGNAENITADIKSGIYATKTEVEGMVSLKADLDTTAAEGGRVLASQMRFDETQTLYVDAAATAEGADGSEAKPFKTIQAAINARYMGAPVIFIQIAPGTYNEDISTPRAPDTTWRFVRNGTGTVSIRNAVIDNAGYVLFENLTFNGPAGDNSTIIYVANTPAVHFNAVTVNGASNSTGINFSTSRGIIRNSAINNCGLAIAATDGAMIDMKSISGTGNTRALQSDGSIILCDYYVPAATTPYERANGGIISVLGGSSTVPSNWAQRLHIGDFTDASLLRAAILAELGKLAVGETRLCWFANNVSGGFGPFDSGQRMICDITKSTDSGKGYGVAVFYSHHSACSGYMQVQDGNFATNTPVKFVTNEDIATTETYGIIKLADETALLSEADEAALTVDKSYELNDFRRMSTAYSVGDKVSCAFRYELFLECTQAGTTSDQTLDTRTVTHGQVITDGTVQWTVRTHVRSINGTPADASGDINPFTPKLYTGDLNNLTTSGIYEIHSEATNGPGVGWGAVVVEALASHVYQKFIPGGGTGFNVPYYNRIKNLNDTSITSVPIGSWSNWVSEIRSVNGVSPDGNGNVTVSAASLGMAGYITSFWSNGNQFCIRYSNGFMMLCGYSGLGYDYHGWATITFPAPFVNTEYSLLVTPVTNAQPIAIISKSTGSAIISSQGSTESATRPVACYWYAFGFEHF